MPTSPSTLNYFIGKGVLKWKSAIPLLTTTADLTSGSAAATLAATTGLVSGETYDITGTGIAAATTFAYGGSASVTLSNNATATGATEPVSVSPDWRDLGNAPEFECTPAIERLDHFSSRHGIKFKDRSVVRQKMMTCRFILEEGTPENLALFFMGNLTAPTGGITYSTINLMDEDEIIGALRFIGTNDIGDKVQVNIPTVNLGPTGALQFITDEWGKMEVTGEITADQTGLFGTIFHGITAEVAA